MLRSVGRPDAFRLRQPHAIDAAGGPELATQTPGRHGNTYTAGIDGAVGPGSAGTKRRPSETTGKAEAGRIRPAAPRLTRDRKRGAEGKGVSVRVVLGCRRNIYTNIGNDLKQSMRATSVCRHPTNKQ